MDDPGPEPLLLVLIVSGWMLVFWFARRLAYRRLDFELTEPARWLSPLGIDCAILFTGLCTALTSVHYQDLNCFLLICLGWAGICLALFWPRLMLLERTANRRDQQQRLEEIQNWFREGLMDFSEGLVSDVMVPLADVFMVNEQSRLDEIVADEDFRPFSRIPVYKGDRRNIVGVLYSKDLIREGLKPQNVQSLNLSGKGLERDAFFVPEMMEQMELLSQFQLKKIQLAIVVDEYGVTSGIVTLEDLLETLIGEIQDRRNDAESFIQEQGLREWQMDARLDLESFSETVGKDFTSDTVDTLGGLVFLLHGKLPQVNQTIASEGYEFTVSAMDGYRLTRIDVREVNP